MMDVFLNRPLNILIFPGGTENGLEILKSLRNLKEINVFGATSDTVNHTEYVFKNVAKVSNVNDPIWIQEINKIVLLHSIDLIFPANSLVIDALNDARDKIDTEILLPSYETIQSTRSKKKTLELLNGLLPTPKIFANKVDIKKYPLFVKPNKGYGSQGSKKIEKPHELELFHFGDDFLVQEFLSGDEYTVDCFSDFNNNLLYASGRTRERIRMGTSMHSCDATTEMQEIFSEYANIINEKFNISGAWFFQLKKDSRGVLKLLEVDIRIAGTMALNRVKGVNFPFLSILNHLGCDVKVLYNNFYVEIDRSLANRYKHNIEFDAVYIDLDDTIIVKQRVNLIVIRFLFQCLNQGKKIILVSKSLEHDKLAYLEKWRIREIFDEIYWLNECESKASYIKDKKAIFIDDSFSQRLDVYKKLNILTFDSSMLEVLLDDRS